MLDKSKNDKSIAFRVKVIRANRVSQRGTVGFVHEALLSSLGGAQHDLTQNKIFSVKTLLPKL